LLVAALLLPTAAVLEVRRGTEVQPKTADLQALSQSIAGWQGATLSIDPEVIETLGKGSYLSRIYTSQSAPPIDLFIAYYSTQRAGDTIHSPKNCLPGSGWLPLESKRMWIPISSSGSIRVNRYVIAMGSERQLVMYWYQAHGRVVASEYEAKFLLVADSIRSNRSDGGMVRLVTPIAPTETVEQSQARVLTFARELYPLLNAYIPQ
jgi:EpsI family protein